MKIIGKVEYSYQQHFEISSLAIHSSREVFRRQLREHFVSRRNCILKLLCLVFHFACVQISTLYHDKREVILDKLRPRNESTFHEEKRILLAFVCGGHWQSCVYRIWIDDADEFHIVITANQATEVRSDMCEKIEREYRISSICIILLSHHNQRRFFISFIHI